MKGILRGIIISIQSLLLSLIYITFCLLMSALIIKYFNIESDLGINITIIGTTSILSILRIHKNIKDIINIKRGD